MQNLQFEQDVCGSKFLLVCRFQSLVSKADYLRSPFTSHFLQHATKHGANTDSWLTWTAPPVWRNECGRHVTELAAAGRSSAPRWPEANTLTLHRLVGSQRLSVSVSQVEFVKCQQVKVCCCCFRPLRLLSPCTSDLILPALISRTLSCRGAERRLHGQHLKVLQSKN